MNAKKYLFVVCLMLVSGVAIMIKSSAVRQEQQKTQQEYNNEANRQMLLYVIKTQYPQLADNPFFTNQRLENFVVLMDDIKEKVFEKGELNSISKFVLLDEIINWFELKLTPELIKKWYIVIGVNKGGFPRFLKDHGEKIYAERMHLTTFKIKDVLDFVSSKIKNLHDNFADQKVEDAKGNLIAYAQLILTALKEAQNVPAKGVEPTMKGEGKEWGV